jgi:small conductance mechanosensitive channel
MEKLKEKILDYLPTAGASLGILVGGFLLTLLIVHIARKALGRSKLDPSLASFFVHVIRVLCLSLVVLSALANLGVSTTGLVAFFSAAVAAVALALKDHISDIASGIVILFTRPFVTGDFIEFGDFKGFVQKIDIVQTKLLTYEDTNIIIPNSKITTCEINNYTAHPEMRVKVNVPISYTADLDTTKRVLLETAKSIPNILTDEAHTPVVRLDKFGESSLDFFVLCWCNFKDYWTVYFTLTDAIKRALDANHIHIPYNQLDVHIIDQPKQDS